MDTTLEPVEEIEDPLLLEEIEHLKGRAVMALVRFALLMAFGAALAFWGVALMRDPGDTLGSGFLIMGVGLWFLMGTWQELPRWARLSREVERLREQWEN